MAYRTKVILLLVASLILIALYMTIDSGGNWEYILPRRGRNLLAIVITGASISFATIVFQTITNNRILTPSIIGLDSLYMLIQTFVVFTFGSMSIAMVNANLNFLLTASGMIVFSFVFYQLLFKNEGEGNNIYFLLLIGLILGTFFSSLTTFMQVLIDPNEFLSVQNRMFASFNSVNADLLVLSLILFIGISIYCFRYMKYLDVLSLGKDHAINLGVPYNKIVKRMLLIVAILISIATALVGPITFLGLLVANVTYEFLKSNIHSQIIPASILISIIALVGGQLIVERVFTFSTTLSVIVNFVGGTYFLYLLLKERKSW